MDKTFFLLVLEDIASDLTLFNMDDVFETVSEAADALVELVWDLSEMQDKPDFTITQCTKVGDEYFDVVTGRKICIELSDESSAMAECAA